MRRVGATDSARPSSRVELEVHAERHFSQRVSEAKVGGGVVDGVADVNEQRADASGGYIGRKRRERGDVAVQEGIDGLDIGDGSLKPGIDPVRKGVDLRRLARPGEDQRAAEMCSQIVHSRFDEPGGVG